MTTFTVQPMLDWRRISLWGEPPITHSWMLAFTEKDVLSLTLIGRALPQQSPRGRLVTSCLRNRHHRFFYFIDFSTFSDYRVYTTTLGLPTDSAIWLPYLSGTITTWRLRKHIDGAWNGVASQNKSFYAWLVFLRESPLCPKTDARLSWVVDSRPANWLYRLFKVYCMTAYRSALRNFDRP